MSNRVALKLASLSASFEQLELSGCYKLGDEALETLLSNCSRLKELNLSTNSNLSSRGIMAISKVSTIQGLFLDNCVQLVDSDLIPLSRCKRTLFSRVVTVVGLTSVTDASICAIVKRSGAGLISFAFGAVYFSVMQSWSKFVPCVRICDVSTWVTMTISVKLHYCLFLLK